MMIRHLDKVVETIYSKLDEKVIDEIRTVFIDQPYTLEDLPSNQLKVKGIDMTYPDFFLRLKSLLIINGYVSKHPYYGVRYYNPSKNVSVDLKFDNEDNSCTICKSSYWRVTESTNTNSVINMIPENMNPERYEQYFLGYPEKKSDYIGFCTVTTGMNYFDNFLYDTEYTYRSGKIAKIITMSPYQYMAICAKDIVSDSPTVQEEISRLLLEDKDSIDNLSKLINEGTKLDMPFLDVDNKQQDGRHRALAALELDIKEIPVLWIRNLVGDDLTEATKSSVTESITSNFDNTIHKISDKKVLVDANDILETLDIYRYEDIDSAIESFQKITVINPTPINQKGIINKVINKWNKIKISLKEMIK